MKRLSFFNKVIFVFNALAAVLLLAACIVPYISSRQLAFLSFLSLAVPLLVGVNFLFFLYWIFKGKKQLRLSLFVLVFGYFILGSFIKFGFSKEEVLDEDLSVMSYNVRVFNKYNVLSSPTIFEDTRTLIKQEKPDIICFQEFDYKGSDKFKAEYPYQFIKYKEGKSRLGIFSKHEIVKADLINFPNSMNNAAYADILYENDTLRVYNVHLQSLGISPGRGVLSKKPSDKLFKMLTKSFRTQQQQAKILEAHMSANNYKQVLCGDFNNTQFSNVYATIRGDKHDTFEEMGVGYGRTLNFHKVPVRIDFILADPALEVKSHKNYDMEYSDHYPIMASFELKSN